MCFFCIVGADDYQIMPNIDISVAVATPNGLITPIVKDVVSKSLPDISNNVKDLALRARDGKLQLQEFQVLLYIKPIPIILMKKFFYVKLFLISIGRNFHNIKSWYVWNQRIHCHNQSTTMCHYGCRIWQY